MKTHNYLSTFQLALTAFICTFLATNTLQGQGCPGLGGLTIDLYDLPVPTLNAPALICPGGAASVAVNQTFTTYDWSTGDAGQTITITDPGTFTVTVTNAGGCIGTASVYVGPKVVPVPQITALPYACTGQVTLDAGNGFSNYLWSNSGITRTITVGASSVYTVTVTNVFGCTGTSSFVATVPPPPLVSISGDTSFCQGAMGNLVATPGLTNYTWSTGQGGQSISVSNSGTFTVSSIDAFGCTATDSVTVIELPVTQPVIHGTTIVCDGANAIFSTTSNFVNYLWSNGLNTDSITISLAGTYSVTVTDAAGCTGTDTETLSTSPALNPAISVTPYACNGLLALDAGTAFSTYSWSNSDTTSAINVTTSASYTVTVTNAQNCSATASYTATIPPPPIVAITGLNAFCPGTSSLLSATTGFNLYNWSSGSNNADISVAATGTYTVTVTDQFDCTATSSMDVSALTAPTPTISGPAQICQTGNATFSVPGTYTLYNWSTGATSPAITVNADDTYTVTVTAVNGCTGTDTHTMTVGNNLQPQILELPYTCNGQISFDAGAGYTAYVWSSGQITQTNTVASNGTYTVTVSDGNGCTGTSIATASIPIQPSVQITGVNAICLGSSTTINATSGFNSYLWGTGQATGSITVNTPGVYDVTTTDALGCSDTASFILGTAPDLQPDILGLQVICSGVSTNLTLDQSYSQYLWSNGAITPTLTVAVGNTYTVTVTDAAGCTGTDAQTITEVTAQTPGVSPLPYACNGQIAFVANAGFNTYAWIGPNGFASINQQVAVSTNGIYTVSVTDQNGCTSSTSVTATIPTVNQVALSGSTQFCPGGSANLMATTGFSSYVWSSGAVLPTISTTSIGTYTVTATDALGCSSTAVVTVSLFPQPTPTITGPQSVCPGNLATLAVAGTFSSYQWSNGNSSTSITATPPFTATVTVTDGNGCSGSASASVAVASPPAPNIVSLPYACNNQITLDAGAAVSYIWSGPNGFNASSQQPTVNTSGTYAVTITDVNGCTGAATIQVTIPVIPNLSILGTPQICPGETASLTASSGFVSYQWSSGQNNMGISVNQTNTYTVTATDNNGCTVTATYLVSPAPPLTPAIVGNNVVCPGNSAIFSVTGNFATYAWSNGASTQTTTVSQPGAYTVTVTNTAGCLGTATLNLSQTSSPVPGLVQQPYQCNGQITLNATTGFNQYNWSNNSNTPVVMIAQSGTYTVTVTDAAGCTGSATIQTSIPAAPTTGISGASAMCLGSTTTLSASGSAVAFTWTGGTSGAQLTVSTAGTFTVTVTDAFGCTATAAETVVMLLPAATLVSRNTCREPDAGTQIVNHTAANGCDSVVTIVTIYEPTNPVLALDLAPEMEATIGQVVTLNVAGNFSIDSVAYESPFDLSCTNCLEPTWTAIESGFIQVTAFDPDGCRTVEDVHVLVNKTIRVFVPNVFQPGSIENGFFSVFSGTEISHVRNFRVFDRWGDALFSRDDMPTNEPSLGWDGTFRGQVMMPGVYVYYFEVLLADGSMVKYSGDVTILK